MRLERSFMPVGETTSAGNTAEVAMRRCRSCLFYFPLTYIFSYKLYISMSKSSKEIIINLIEIDLLINIEWERLFRFILANF